MLSRKRFFHIILVILATIVTGNSVAKTNVKDADPIDRHVLMIAKTAIKKAKKNLGINAKPIVTIVDFSKPSTDKRLWVIDTSNNKVIFNTWVAHGRNSGFLNSTKFSNRPSSNQSSLGVYITKGKYHGKHGLSVVLEGLEPEFNSNARSRGIIMHSASYASRNFLRSNGRLGRSLGCFSLDPEIGKEIMNYIYSNTLIVAYYPDEYWLKNSELT